MRALIEERMSIMEGVAGMPVMVSDFDSSNVHSMGYDEPSRTLYVRFWKDSGSKRSQVPGQIYKYFNVPKKIYMQFYYSKSKGKFIWERLRERYRYTMIGRKGWRGPVSSARPNAKNPAKNLRNRKRRMPAAARKKKKR